MVFPISSHTQPLRSWETVLNAQNRVIALDDVDRSLGATSYELLLLRDVSRQIVLEYASTPPPPPSHPSVSTFNAFQTEVTALPMSGINSWAGLIKTVSILFMVTTCLAHHCSISHPSTLP